jgi:membrane-associated phospholipid phosphatase
MAELPVDLISSPPIDRQKAATRSNAAHPRILYIDIALVSAAFLALIALGIANHTPLIDISRSRLTRRSFHIFGAFLIVTRLLCHRPIAPVILDWIPLVGLFAVYENLKHMHANKITEWLGIAPKDQLMASIDNFLFGAELPLELQGCSPPWFIFIMWFFYFWVYYCGPAFLLGWIYFRIGDQDLFARLRHLLMIAFLGGYVIYLLVPVAGPMFTIGDRFSTPIVTHPLIQTLAFSYRYNWDCFPSLHTAIPWLLTIAVWRKIALTGRLICLLASVGVTASTVFLRFHYGIDLIAGFVWALVVYAIVLRCACSRSWLWNSPLTRLQSRPNGNPTAIERTMPPA